MRTTGRPVNSALLTDKSTLRSAGTAAETAVETGDVRDMVGADVGDGGDAAAAAPGSIRPPAARLVNAAGSQRVQRLRDFMAVAPDLESDRWSSVIPPDRGGRR
ncbi:hypothetical protein GCM10023317_30620 [Actinopolymorpha pittospori]